MLPLMLSPTRQVGGRRIQGVAFLHVFRTVKEMVDYRDGLPRSTSVGFVPTMGALHVGHLSLVDRARKECDVTIASIFVNGKQFSAGEDLDKYPRQLEADLKMLTDAGVDAVFAPTDNEMYPPGGSLCHVEPSAFSHILEGQARPEFFRGVATVVAKLFNIVQPTVSYFGQKDISQCILLMKMVRDLNFRTKLQVCPTLRAEDGLALSSRNAYLSAAERPLADVLFRALNAGKQFFADFQGEDVPSQAIRQQVENVLRSQPLVSKVEYVSIASHHNMAEMASVPKSQGAVISSAIRLGQVRLIDNLLIGPAESDILSAVKR